MADSDSDLEVLDEIPVVNSQASRSLRSRRSSDLSISDIEDELLDLDDDAIVDSGNNGVSSLYGVGGSSTSKTKSNGVNGLKKKHEVAHVLPPDDEEDVESVVTEVVGDDDLDSLPSIPSPSAPTFRETEEPRGIADDNDIMELDNDDDGIGDSYPTYQSSSGSGTALTSLSKSSSKSSLRGVYDDRDEFDDLVEGAECESLADYLAKIDNKNKPKKSSKVKSTSISSSIASSSTSGTSKSIPSFSSFARQTAASRKSNPKSASVITKPSSGISEKPVTSYQVNRKSPKKSRAKKKDKDSVTTTSTATSSSSTSVPSLPATTADQAGRLKKPKDVLKMIILQIPENVLSNDLTEKLIEKEIQFKIIESPTVPDSIMFEHNVPYKQIGIDGQVQEKAHVEIDDNILVIFRVEEHLEILQAELNRVSASSSEGTSECLTEWIKKFHRDNSKRKITLLINGLEGYLRKIQRAQQKEYRDRVLQGDNPDNTKKKRKANASQGIKLSRYEVQNALISAQLETHMNYRFYENNSDLALLLLQYTKSVGEAPYKQEKKKTDGFDWYAVEDAVGGIPVEENGEGMISLWIAQLEQFPKVGQESALAIARTYGSPKALYEAYRRCNSLEEGKSLLTNIQVTMGVGPLAKTRRLGPEASKRIYRFFTSTDGEREIDG